MIIKGEQVNKFNPLILITLLSTLVSINVAAEDDEPGAGHIAPDFEITQMDGTQFKLS